jgi:Resolvase, N terminal domain
LHISLTYGVSEATVCRTIKKVENVLVKSKQFHLPGKKALQPSEQQSIYVLPPKRKAKNLVRLNRRWIACILRKKTDLVLFVFIVIWKDIGWVNKLVEPSGTRSDRPGLLAMLNDATKDELDVILAWREDRLYRGLRSMLTVLETVQDYKIEIMLAKENFDPKITPVRAWAAQMELNGMKERMGMGVKARLKAGKANTGQDHYGYICIVKNILWRESQGGSGKSLNGTTRVFHCANS